MSFFFNVSILLCFLVDSDRFASFRKDDIESSDAFFRDWKDSFVSAFAFFLYI